MTEAALPPALALRPRDRDRALATFGKLIKELELAAARKRLEIKHLAAEGQNTARVRISLGLVLKRAKRLRAGQNFLLWEGEAS